MIERHRFGGAFASVEGLLYRHRNALLWALYLVACASLFRGIAQEERYPYPIREMLLNYADGIVRRGLSGEVILWAQRTFGGEVVHWAYGISCLMAGALFAMSIGLYRRLPADPVQLPLILAPWGLAFFAYDSIGSFRKEILGYVAILLIVRACFAASARTAMNWMIFGALFYVVVLYVHEGVATMAPALLMACGLLVWQFPDLKRFVVGLVILCGLLTLVTLLLLALLPQRDPALLCAAVADPVCKDPFAWVGRSFADGVSYTIARRDRVDLPFYAVFAALAVLPLRGIEVHGWSRRMHWLALSASVMCMVPVFLSAYDWGRWIQMIVLPLSLVGLAAVALGKAQCVRILPAWAVLVYIGTLGLSHATYTYLTTPMKIWPLLMVVVVVHRLVRGSWA
jgi:hypothetical protein